MSNTRVTDKILEKPHFSRVGIMQTIISVQQEIIEENMKIQINLRDITFLGFIFCPLKRAEPAENRVEIRQFNIFKPKNPEFKSRKFIEKMKYYYTDIIYKLVKGTSQRI